jgi:peroxiredoxin
LGEGEHNGHAADDMLEAADAVEGDLALKLARYDEAARRRNRAGAAQYDRLVQRLCELGTAGSVPKTGEMFPEFQLPAHTGEMLRLSELTAQGPLIVSFNRGHRCPYCRLELRALARLAPALQARQAHCVAIVPERPEFAAHLVARDKLPFKVLSDLDHGYAASLGLAVSVGQEVAAAYQGVGVDLPRYQGHGGWLVPVPATFVVGADRRILSSFADPDFRRRISMEAIRATLGV